MILPIVSYGTPILKKNTEEIGKTYPNLKELISNMYETMYAAPGVGLAAPQIGLSIRLFIIDASGFADEDNPELDNKYRNTVEKILEKSVNPKSRKQLNKNT